MYTQALRIYSSQYGELSIHYWPIITYLRQASVPLPFSLGIHRILRVLHGSQALEVRGRGQINL